MSRMSQILKHLQQFVLKLIKTDQSAFDKETKLQQEPATFNLKGILNKKMARLVHVLMSLMKELHSSQTLNDVMFTVCYIYLEN